MTAPRLETKIVVFLLLVFASRTVLCGQASEFQSVDDIKRWTIHTSRGSLANIRLFSHARAGHPESTGLTFSFDTSAGSPSIEDETEVLGDVLRDLPPLGYEASSLSLITIPLDSSAFRVDILRSISDSADWTSCIRLKYCAVAQTIADHFLKSTDAYAVWDQMLASNHLERKRVSIDDMACGRNSKRQNDATDNPEQNLAVDCAALIDIELGKNSD